MKDIKECANLYKQLLNKSYTFKLENDIEFTIHFNSSNFFHLIGLHKLTDLERMPDKGYKQLRYNINRETCSF